MRIDTALLCDKGNVRGGLLNIIGGGINRLRRPSFPAPLGVELAVRVMVHQQERDKRHNFEARLIDEDGASVGNLGLDFKVEDVGDVRPVEEFSVAFVMEIQQLPLEKPGAYSFECLIDGIHQLSIPFLAEEAPAQ